MYQECIKLVEMINEKRPRRSGRSSRRPGFQVQSLQSRTRPQAVQCPRRTASRRKHIRAPQRDAPANRRPATRQRDPVRRKNSGSPPKRCHPVIRYNFEMRKRSFRFCGVNPRDKYPRDRVVVAVMISNRRTRPMGGPMNDTSKSQPLNSKQRLDSGEKTRTRRRPRTLGKTANAASKAPSSSPMGSIPSNLQKLDTDEPVICYCHHGMRSLDVVNWLRQQGILHCQIPRRRYRPLVPLEIDPKVPRYIRYYFELLHRLRFLAFVVAAFRGGRLDSSNNKTLSF